METIFESELFRIRVVHKESSQWKNEDLFIEIKEEAMTTDEFKTARLHLGFLGETFLVNVEAMK
jgi:hypothetical protein